MVFVGWQRLLTVDEVINETPTFSMLYRYYDLIYVFNVRTSLQYRMMAVTWFKCALLKIRFRRVLVWVYLRIHFGQAFFANVVKNSLRLEFFDQFFDQFGIVWVHQGPVFSWRDWPVPIARILNLHDNWKSKFGCQRLSTFLSKKINYQKLFIFCRGLLCLVNAAAAHNQTGFAKTLVLKFEIYTAYLIVWLYLSNTNFNLTDKGETAF